MLFTDKQIEYLRSLGLDMEFNNLSDDDDESWGDIEDAVADSPGFCFGEDGYPTEEGWMCESIIDLLPQCRARMQKHK